MTKISRFKPEKDQTLIDSWLAARNWPATPTALLPTLGYVAFDELTGAKLAACFLYTTNSQLAIIGWPVANPTLDPEHRDHVHRLLIEHINEVARALGFKFVMAMAGQETVVNRLKEAGYQAGDSGMVHLFKTLGV